MAAEVDFKGRDEEQLDDLDTVIENLNAIVASLNLMVQALTSLSGDSWQVQTP